MASNTTATTASASSVERGIALAEVAAPIVTGILAPLADGGATVLGSITYGVGAGFLITNYMNRVPDRFLHQLPAGDIIRAHRSPMFMSTVTSGMALLVGTVQGIDGTDGLMAGILDIPANPIPGIISLGWWFAVGLVPYKLRNIIFGHRKKTAPAAVRAAAAAATATAIPLDAQQIIHDWYKHISNHENGTHKGQDLTLRTLGPQRWTGTITALTGSSVTVTADTVSSVYRRNADWITLAPGAHSGEKHIVVNLVAPLELDTSTLQGAWKKWAARNGGVMAGTHLEDIQPDPNTGGQVARVVADENTDTLPKPDMRALVGALRTSHLLLSYEPSDNPRRAKIRLMKENPLQAGVPFSGPHSLLPSAGGYFRVGLAVSGRPVRVQLLDPKLGARHVVVTGVTGSGKGGVLQLIALASHLAGAVILNADPKGSSNPAIEIMAAYSGLGEDGAMGTLRIVRALVEHRIEKTAQLKQKNFDPAVMRHVVVVLDEASSLLGDSAKHRKEAAEVVDLVARKGRSLGVSMVLANQILQLDQLGGKSSIRDNIVGSGGVIMLRSDSSQRHLIDLPPGMEGCNPADIPATWSGEDEDTLVYTDDTTIADPESTFGLGYFMTTDGVCAMGRSDTLEDATPYVDTERVYEPTDWPGWENRHEVAATSSLDNGEDVHSDSDPLFGPFEFMKKPETAQDKILKVFEDLADPISTDINYIHLDTISRMAATEGSTLNHNLGALVKAGKIHRQPKTPGKDVRGMYGLGPAPAADSE